MGARHSQYSVTPTVTAGAYSANDIVGGPLDFGNVPQGLLRAVIIVDEAKQAGAYQLLLFRSVPTTIADNDTYDIADADVKNLVGAIHITDTAGADKFDFADNKAYVRQGLALPIVPGTDLYGYLICLGTPTYAATTDVKITLSVEHG
jgi:hypothetical protein